MRRPLCRGDLPIARVPIAAVRRPLCRGDLPIARGLDRVVVKEDGYEVVFKAGVTVEVEI